MTSSESPYSRAVQLLLMGDEPQSSPCECHSPKLWPISCVTTPFTNEPLTHACDGLPPTVPSPHHPQAFGGNAYTRRRYEFSLPVPTSLATAFFAPFAIAPVSQVVLLTAMV